MYQLSEGGTVERLAGQCVKQSRKLFVKVTTTHLSTFVVLPVEAVETVELPFTDVKETDWFYDAVVYAYTNGLFNGTSETTFSPNGVMTRSMLVTVLWRLEGEPEATAAAGFADVEAGSWYAGAVAWASANNIVAGTGTGFAPTGNVTREQIATILYRYAKFKGWDVSGDESLTGFTDGGETSEWAARAMRWAWAEQIITGKDGGRLDPQGQATRAEVATILMRFCEKQET